MVEIIQTVRAWINHALKCDIGSLEEGELTDLIILDKDPLENIRSTNSILYVMKNGRLYEGNTLNEVHPNKREAGKFCWKLQEPMNLPGVK